MEVKVSCNPLTTDRIISQVWTCQLSKLHVQSVLQVKDQGSDSVCRSLEGLPKRWELVQQETGFLLKAQSFKLASNLHPVKRILFVRPEQTKTPQFKQLKLSRNWNDLPVLFHVLHSSKLLPLSPHKKFFRRTGSDGGSLNTAFTILEEQQTASLRTF